ncbi:MAG: hypothetical protein ACKVOH_06505 [Chlamydiales bacterium]
MRTRVEKIPGIALIKMVEMVLSADGSLPAVRYPSLLARSDFLSTVTRCHGCVVVRVVAGYDPRIHYIAVFRTYPQPDCRSELPPILSFEEPDEVIVP